MESEPSIYDKAMANWMNRVEDNLKTSELEKEIEEDNRKRYEYYKMKKKDE